MKLQMKLSKILAVMAAALILGGCGQQAAESQNQEREDASVKRAELYESYEETALTLESPVFSLERKPENGLLGMSFSGLMGERMANQMNRWMYTAYYTNPTMVEAFRQRESSLSLDLMAWYGEFPGKYLYSTALSYALNHDENLKLVSEELIGDLASVQGEDGYLGVFSQTDRMLGQVENEINGRENQGANWDLWNHYHIIRGLLAWYGQTGNETAFQTAQKAADYLISFFSNGHTLEEVGETDKNLSIVSVFADLYGKTGESRYLDFVNDIVAAWQLSGNGNFYQEGIDGTPFSALSQNRWEAMHAVLGLADIYEISGDENFKTAFLNLWSSLREADRRNTGGATVNEQALGSPYVAGSVETCANVTYLELTARALALTDDSKIADEAELTTLNVMLGSQNKAGRWYTYNTPDNGVRLASSHEIVFQSEPGSPELNCCAVNGPCGFGLISKWAASADTDFVTLNYYGAGQAALKTPGGKNLILSQETDYPVSGNVKISLSLEQEESFALRLRIPAWSKSTAVKAGEETYPAQPGTYCVIDRKWKDGDTIELTLDMALHFWQGEQNRDGTVSVYYGPLLLALDARYNQNVKLEELDAYDISSMTLEPVESAVVPSEPAPVVLFKADFGGGKELYLCDFATAGMAGTEYITWIPAAGTENLTQAEQPDRWLSVLPQA